MDIREIVLDIANTLFNKKAKDVLIIDIGEKSSLADYFLLVSGGNYRQLEAFKDEAEDVLDKYGMEIKSLQGKSQSGWILMDCGDIVINFLTEEMREKYNIEGIWSDCKFTELEDEID